MKRIGFIGTGTMGEPMAENLIEAGYNVTVYNRTKEKTEKLAKMGAKVADNPKEAAVESEIIITIVTDGPAVKSVLFGDSGAIEGMEPDSILIDMSTISPQNTEEIAKKVRENDCYMLDAPVSGGEEGAIEGNLSIMVGGEKEIFEESIDLLEVLGDKVTYVGKNGMGQVAKACNQIIVALSLGAVGEALTLASKSGADPEKVMEAIKGGAADCWALRARSKKMIDRDFEPGFKSSHHYKDLEIATDTGSKYGAVLPLTHLIHEFYGSMKQKGKGDYDHSAIFTIIEDLSNSKLKREE